MPDLFVISFVLPYMIWIQNISISFLEIKYLDTLHSCAFDLQVSIWEERKVFGSRGQILKEELVGKNLESSNHGNGKDSGLKLVCDLISRVKALHTYFILLAL